MKQLTKKNARDGMMIRPISFPHDNCRTLKRGLNGWDIVLPNGPSRDIQEANFHRWEIVEDAPDLPRVSLDANTVAEPPLVSLDPQNPPELPLNHIDSAQARLELLGPIVDGLVRMVEVVLDSHPPVMANWDLLHAVLVELNEAQSLITGQEPEPKGEDNVA